MLKFVTPISRKYYKGAVVTILVLIAFLSLSACAITGLIVGHEDKSISIEACAGLVGFAGLYILWALFFISNSTRLAVSGVFARCCYLGVSNDQTVELPLKNPTLQSARKALTTSFGSSCYFYNRNYLIANVAIHGRDHRTARQHMIQSKHFEDNHQSLMLFVSFLSMFSALYTVLVTDFAVTMIGINKFISINLFAAFNIGAVMSLISLSLITSGFATMLVCL